jgi:hypothetical protein
MTPTTVLACVQRSVVVFEIFGEEVRRGSPVVALQDSIPDACGPTFLRSGVVVDSVHMDAAVYSIMETGLFQIRWTTGSEMIQ